MGLGSLTSLLPEQRFIQMGKKIKSVPLTGNRTLCHSEEMSALVARSGLTPSMPCGHPLITEGLMMGGGAAAHLAAVCVIATVILSNAMRFRKAVGRMFGV